MYVFDKKPSSIHLIIFLLAVMPVSVVAQCVEGEFCAIGNPDIDSGPCFTAGTIACTEEGEPICELNGPEDIFSFEGPAGDSSCFDQEDNNCDGLVDHQEAICQTEELCNGFDDDNDGEIDESFVGLGSSCSAGIGACEAIGTFICSDDQFSMVCSVAAADAGTEGPAQSVSCQDGIDNNCDGLVDILDPFCQSAETCDGLDNDGDLLVDEDFETLGQTCMNGLGACQRSGVNVCSADGTQTQCNSIPLAASIEGPSGSSCFDGIDNDCDGYADALDSNCDSSMIAVKCSLPYVSGSPGKDCNGKHRIEFETSGYGPDAVITAELIALDEFGNQMQSIPVRNGDLVHMASRQKMKMGTVRKAKVTEHTVYAPVPMLRVVIEDDLSQSEAYCSSIPFLDLVKPSESHQNTGPGGELDVLSSIPLVDLSSLQIKVDGVDIVHELGLDANTDFPGGPYEGTVEINGREVEISELVVDGATSTGEMSSNTLRMSLTNLGGGGHVVVMDGDPIGSFPQKKSNVCLADDIQDSATASNFSITLDPSAPRVLETEIPTPVLGEVLNGRPIASVWINGQAQDISGQEFIPGDGETSAGTYRVPIDTLLGQADVAEELRTGNSSHGTFDRGWNHLIAHAQDELGNQAFANEYFAIVPSEAQAFTVSDEVTQITSSASVSATDSQEFNSGLVFGLTTGGIQELLSAAYEKHGHEIKARLDTTSQPWNNCLFPLKNAQGATISRTPADELRCLLEKTANSRIPKPPPFFGCAMSPYFSLYSIGVNDDTFDFAKNIQASLEPGKINFTANLPDLEFRYAFDGYCKKVERICLGVKVDGKCIGLEPEVCLIEVGIHAEGQPTLNRFPLSASITKAQIENGSLPDFTAGVPIVLGHIIKPPPDSFQKIGCLAGAVVDLVNVFVPGAFFFIGGSGNIGDGMISPALNLLANFGQILQFWDFGQNGLAIPVPIPPNIKDNIPAVPLGINESASMIDFSIVRDNILITGDPRGGFSQSFRTTFNPQIIDPDFPALPALELTPAPTPEAPVGGADNTFVAMSDDAFNGLLSSLTAAGKFKQECAARGEIGDILKKDCDAYQAVNPDGAALIQGQCHGLRAAECGELEGATARQGAIKRGSCEKTKVGNCRAFNPLTAPVEFLTCQSTPDFQLKATTKLLACPVLNIPPRMYLQGQTSSAGLSNVAWRLNDLQVKFIADRNEDGVPGEKLALTPYCGDGKDTSANDCDVVDLCFRLNAHTDLELISEDDIHKIQTTILGVQEMNDPTQIVCQGGPVSRLVNNSPSTLKDIDDAITALLDSMEGQTPTIDASALKIINESLKGYGRFANPRLIGIETDGDHSFQDYLGITGNLVGEK